MFAQLRLSLQGGAVAEQGTPAYDILKRQKVTEHNVIAISRLDDKLWMISFLSYRTPTKSFLQVARTFLLFPVGDPSK